VTHIPQDGETSLEASLEAGQLEISPSKKDNIHAWKNLYKQKNVF